MAKTDRIELIKQIEEEVNANLIAYVVGDRRGLGFPIAGDVVKILYEQLLLFSNNPTKKENIALFLYSRGGHGDVPWQIVPMIREFSNGFYVLVPYRAHSAATLIALGADKVFMGRKGELGPVDPSSQSLLHPINPYAELKQPLPIGVEDVTSYLSLIKKVGLVKQTEVAKSFNLLAEKVGPLALGNLMRFHSHTMLLIERLLKTHKIMPKKRKIKHIIENLTEKIFFHGHAIGRKEAINDIGLDVQYPNEKLEKLIWDLYLQYEKEMKLTEPFEREFILLGNESAEERGLIAAYIESTEKTNVCKLDLSLKKKRKTPSTLNLNVNVSLPPGLDASRLPANFMQQLRQNIQRIVNDQVRIQSPVVGIETKTIGGGWQEES